MIVSHEQLLKELRWLRSDNAKIVFTNGCFDLLHAGHVDLLTRCYDLGAVVVGLNSDASIRRLKGPSRPIVPQDQRAIVINALWSVQLVTIFDEDTPAQLIEQIRPDILVKGDEYTEEQIVGAAFVRSYGGNVLRLSKVAGVSTSGIVARLLKSNSKEGATGED